MTASKISTLDESRSYPRTHLFVAASLCSNNVAEPVRIRNLSPVGALIEGSGIPEPCTEVILKRGSLQAVGQIAWQVGKKGGVAFSKEVNVSDWLSSPPIPHQARIDGIVADLKSGAGPASAAHAGPAFDESPLLQQLLELRAGLIQLGNSLSDDAALVMAHPEIQKLDILAQRVDQLVTRLVHG